MSLKPGTQLGTYQILALIGAGGMGEVYKAKDTKLDRLVAVKVLPPSLAADQGLLARFDREAKAVAALSHPNVLGIFDLAMEGGLTYAVMELLAGETLRDKLKGGALPPKRAIEIATELANGLGAAHERGIVHRDVKPENIFITSEGRVKVLDFGLAKQVAEPRGNGVNLETEAMSLTPNGTEAGTVLGTAGYMSPEQVKGEPADHRSDIFSFGIVLYEMLSGQRPFKGETAHHTMTAILDQEPPALTAIRGPVPPALERLVSHCLEKSPKARFQSMADLAYDLQNLSTASTTGQRPVPQGRLRLSLPAALLPAAAVLLAWGGLMLAGILRTGPELGVPEFTRLTHTPGTIESAFFGPDGRTVYFSERTQGGAPEVFVLHAGAREPQPMGVKDALLLGVSATGDLAVLRHPLIWYGTLYQGTLAQVDGTTGSVREVQELTTDAAWDGAGFATMNQAAPDKVQITFAGNLVEQINPSVGKIQRLRVAPGGERLALIFADTISHTDIVTYDRAGHRQVRFTKAEDANGDTLTGLAWGPDGTLWFSELQGDQTSLWSLRGNGSRRLIWKGEGTKALLDVAKDGRYLLADQKVLRGVHVQKAGEPMGRDLTIASGTQALGLSADGRTLLLLESPVVDGGTSQDATYVWTEDGGPPARIAQGACLSLSADGRWAQVQYTGLEPKELDPAVAAAIKAAGLDPAAVLDPKQPAPCLIFVPVGAGLPFALALPKNLDFGNARLLPDGHSVIFPAIDQGHFHWYRIDRAGGPPRVLPAPTEFCQMYAGLVPLSPDGTRMILGGENAFAIQALAGGELEPIHGLGHDDRPMGWAQDGHSIYIRKMTWPLVVSRLDPGTGARTPVFTYNPGDPNGLTGVRSVFTTPDARLFAICYIRKLSSLYLVEGLK